MMKKKKRILLSFLAGILVLAAILISILYRFRNYIGLTLSEIEMVQAALEGSTEHVTYDFLMMDEETNTITVCFYLNGDEKPEVCNQVREQINKYLKKHPDSSLHKSYLEVIFKSKDPNQLAYLECTNFDTAVRNSQEPAEQYDTLCFISYLHLEEDAMKLSRFQNYTDIRGFEANEAFTIDDITVFDQMRNLEVLYMKNYTKKQRDYLERTHPGIKILDYIE